MSSTTHSDFSLDAQQAIHQLRSHWEFSNVAQFMHTFYNAFGLESFDTDEFELSLVAKESPQLTNLIVQMLRTLTSNKKITIDNWERHLYQLYSIYEPEKSNPFESEGDQKNFKDMSIIQKMLILHDLCHWQMRNPDKFRQHLDSQDDSQTWRVSPIGYDSKGNTYWLFDDNRLCKEAPKVDTEKPKGRGKSARRNRSKKASATTAISTTTDQNESTNWETVCVTAAEWESFPAQFEKTRNSAEKAFFKLLTNDLLPRVLAVLKEKEKDRKKLDALANRKRSSRLLKKEIERQEADRIAQIEREKYEEEMMKEKKESRIESQASRAIQEDHKKIEDQDQLDSSIQVPLPQPQAHEQPNNDWYFECLCGVSGNNINDNSRMIACDRCSVWQHLDCISKIDPRFLMGHDYEKIDYVCEKCLRNTAAKSSMPVSSSHEKGISNSDARETKMADNSTTDKVQGTWIVSKIGAQMDTDRISNKRPRNESDNERLETGIPPVKSRKRQTGTTRKTTRKDNAERGKNKQNTNDNVEREVKRIKNGKLIVRYARKSWFTVDIKFCKAATKVASCSYSQQFDVDDLSGFSMIPPRTSSYGPLCGTVSTSSSNGLSNYTITHAASHPSTLNSSLELPAISPPAYGLSNNILRSTSLDVLPPITSTFGPSVDVSAQKRSFEPFSGPIEPQYSGPHFSPYSRADGLSQTIPPPSLLSLPNPAQYKNESNNNEPTPKIMDIKSLVS
ncbi:3133_t:CDS:10 [Acaulospora morrowiae]|uniref:3133_t:CDS:1 n=1 Tax=Acaulospora morrowiae TaxID=94023 RepID=A0A9N9G051_9GLOM|nr:3133_t:CDS:10 [Acaulospora morrowiae]